LLPLWLPPINPQGRGFDMELAINSNFGATQTVVPFFLRFAFWCMVKKFCAMVDLKRTETLFQLNSIGAK
jgi:hypothetical protein